MESVHRTVLLQETIEGLNLPRGNAFRTPQGVAPGQVTIVDATFGGGGHSKEILDNYPNVKIIALDQDKSAWEKAESKFEGLEKRISFANANFRELDKILQKEGVEKVDGIIFDLGLSSDQLENSLRGFSFMRKEPLLMTMKENPSREEVTAFDVVNTWSEKSLADIIYGYGEEKYSRKIAKGIVDARQKENIKTTFDLVKIIENSVPSAYKRGRLHFATKTFQALRIAVNDELGSLTEGLDKGYSVLKEGGRMSVISFHSLEDRIVKKFFKNKEKEGKAKLINKKPILASGEELKNNIRARSAKLRILEKTHATAGQV